MHGNFTNASARVTAIWFDAASHYEFPGDLHAAHNALPAIKRAWHRHGHRGPQKVSQLVLTTYGSKAVHSVRVSPMACSVQTAR